MQIYRAYIKTNADVNMQFYSHNKLPLLRNRQSPTHGTNASYSTLLFILTVLVRIICKKTHTTGSIFCMQGSSAFTVTELS